jgi:hypothetical protein
MARVNLTTTTASGITVSYAVTSGALPAGMTLNASTGIISGTPVTTGYSAGGVASSVDITATNHNYDYNTMMIVMNWIQ